MLEGRGRLIEIGRLSSQTTEQSKDSQHYPQMLKGLDRLKYWDTCDNWFCDSHNPNS